MKGRYQNQIIYMYICVYIHFFFAFQTGASEVHAKGSSLILKKIQLKKENVTKNLKIIYI